MADVSQIKLPNGSVYDLIDEKSGYITAEYIENKTDYEIPVSRVGEIVVGETAIGTDSTNFPTSKAVVDYVDERVVQEMDAIDVGVTEIKANGTSLSINDGVVNIPVVGPNQSVGLMTDEYMENIFDSIPTSTSQLTNDSGFITSETDPTVPDWAKASTKPTYTAGEVGALPSNTFIPQVFKVFYYSSTNTADKTYTEIDQAYNRGDLVLLLYNGDIYQTTRASTGYIFTTITDFTSRDGQGNVIKTIKQLKLYTSNTWHITSYQFPSKTSDLTNDSGYLTASDIASVMSYKGTKANYAALPASGNITGDVWHLTDTGAEWAWDGSAWQELGTAIDLSGYVPTSRTVNGKALSSDITLSASDVGALSSSTTIPTKVSDLTNDSGFITSYTETDPIFSASAAAGISSSNITSWNNKFDKSGGVITGDVTIVKGKSLYFNTNTTAGDNDNLHDIRIFHSSYNANTNVPNLKFGTRGSASSGVSLEGIKNISASTYNGFSLNMACTKSVDDSISDSSSSTNLPTSAAVASFVEGKGYITSYTETDPVFSASAAAGITSTDISNWNAKVSDDKTWNGVSLGVSGTYTAADQYIPVKATNALSGTASQIVATQTPAQYRIAKYDDNAYLNSTTPSANDNSTKVATTAYVDAAIPKVYSSTNTGGYLTMATLPIYNGTVE